MRTDIYPTLATLLEQRFGCDPTQLSPEASLENLGLDSLSLMDFVFAAEDAFHLRIPETLLDPRQGGITLQHICEVIESLLPPPSADAGSTP
ncbi:MAG: acyl carrier protein [Burkholderiaceae bacterium]|nr:acyl carrier protein [Burkholderiaceae bacterium]